MSTGIEWVRNTDATQGKTWNPILGCTHVSEGCDHCYAATLASGRLKSHPLYEGLAEGGKFTGIVRLVPDRLEEPLHVRKPTTWFVNSMSDLFHDDVPDDFIARVFAVMALAPRHTFQVLTKRPGRMASLLGRDEFRILVDVAMVRMRKGVDPAPLDVRRAIAKREAAWLPIVPPFPLPNVWLGTSVENQKWAQVRIPKLLQTLAAVHFLSCEPLLGPIDFDAFGELGLPCDMDGAPYPYGIEWVIVGGESGAGARPMDVQWARSLVEQCQAAGVPVFVKQLGAHPGFRLEDEEQRGNVMPSFHHFDETSGLYIKAMDDKKGGDPSEWPEDLRVREMPERAS